MKAKVKVNLERGAGLGVADASQVGYSIAKLIGAITIELDSNLYRVGDRLTEKEATRLTQDSYYEVTVTAKK